MQLSLVIPCKDKEDQKLKELLNSIELQDFPKDQLETLIITEGTSESAKAIGIRRANGEVIGILASDNQLVYPDFLSQIMNLFPMNDAVWPDYYFRFEDDNILNRYFALIGGNDPLCFYMGKNDRRTHLDTDVPKFPVPTKCNKSYGDNGFFIKKEVIERTNLDNYYHVDNANEAMADRKTASIAFAIWHKTGGNLIEFFKKRYRYGLQHAFNKNRRWHLVDFRQPKDIVRLIWFVICSVTLVEPLILSFRGFRKIQDVAWFLHPVVCLMTTLTYSLLLIHLGISRMFPLPSAPTVAQKA